MSNKLILVLVGFAIAVGGVPGGPGPGVTITSKGGADMGEDGKTITYKEKVRFDHPDQKLTIECDRLEVFSSAPPELKLLKAIATGHVEVRQLGPDGKPGLARGDEAVFDAAAKTTTITGEPQVVLDVGGDYLLHAESVTLRPNGQHRLLRLPRVVFTKPKKAENDR